MLPKRPDSDHATPVIPQPPRAGAIPDQKNTPSAKPTKKNPFANIKILIELGGQGKLRQAKKLLGGLLENDSYSRKVRAEAAYELAKMYDPRYFSTQRSPLSKPDANVALNYYRRAESLGASGLAKRISRLSK